MLRSGAIIYLALQLPLAINNNRLLREGVNFFVKEARLVSLFNVRASEGSGRLLAHAFLPRYLGALDKNVYGQ